MRKVVLANHILGPLYPFFVSQNRLPIKGSNSKIIMSQDSELAVLQIHNLARIWQNGRGIGSDVFFIVGETDKKRTGISSYYYFAGMISMDKDKSICSDYRLESKSYRLFKAHSLVFSKILNQVGHNFRIGIGLKLMPPLQEPVL